MSKKTYTKIYLCIQYLDVKDVLFASGGENSDSNIKDSYDWLD